MWVNERYSSGMMMGKNKDVRVKMCEQIGRGGGICQAWSQECSQKWCGKQWWHQSCCVIQKSLRVLCKSNENGGDCEPAQQKGSSCEMFWRWIQRRQNILDPEVWAVRCEPLRRTEEKIGGCVCRRHEGGEYGVKLRQSLVHICIRF